MRVFLIVAAIVGALWAMYLVVRGPSQSLVPFHRRKQQDPRFSLFHEPPGGCPAGTTRVPGAFEFEGQTLCACFDPHGNGAVDYLRPNESLRINYTIWPFDPDDDPLLRS